jgi:hypothetical protein
LNIFQEAIVIVLFCRYNVHWFNLADFTTQSIHPHNKVINASVIGSKRTTASEVHLELDIPEHFFHQFDVIFVKSDWGWLPDLFAREYLTRY